MSLRNDIMRFWFLGYRGEIKTELQAPVDKLKQPALPSNTVWDTF